MAKNKERKSKLCRLRKCENKSALASEQAVRDSIDSLPRDLWLTITRDNGTGSNENTNGLFRRYFPKKTDFAIITDSEIANVEYLLNSRPRKRLGRLTPYEVFYQKTGVALDS